jgi:hypothetical protein
MGSTARILTSACSQRSETSQSETRPEFKMRIIHVQVQPQRERRLDFPAADESLRAVAKNRKLVRGFRFEEGSDSGSYMNFHYLTTKPAELWQALRSGPLRSRFLRSTSMVVCEGANGWDDYLLLHHWDGRLKRDRAPTNSNATGRRRAIRARP